MTDDRRQGNRRQEVNKDDFRWRANFMLSAAYLVVFSLIFLVWRADVEEFAQGVITLILGRFLGYLDNIYVFEFGTTRANQVKDSTIERLSNTASTVANTASTAATTAAKLADQSDERKDFL